MSIILDTIAVSSILDIMSNTPSTTEQALRASFEERSAWIQLTSLVVALGGYFIAAGVLLAEGATELTACMPLFVMAIVVVIVINVVFHVLAAVAGRAEDADERDRVIVWRAEAGSGWVLACGVFFALCALLFRLAPVWTAHLLLLFWFLSDTLRCALQLRYYRAGM